MAVPEPRLARPGSRSIPSKEINPLPAKINFVDIAGLVKGASKGEGLGNQFLANIREVRRRGLCAPLLRSTIDITHVSGKVDPLADAEVVETELMLADLESLEKRRNGVEKKAKGGDKDAKLTLDLIDRAAGPHCANGKSPASSSGRPRKKRPSSELQLLTSKPALYVCNVDEARPPPATP